MRLNRLIFAVFTTFLSLALIPSAFAQITRSDLSLATTPVTYEEAKKIVSRTPLGATTESYGVISVEPEINGGYKKTVDFIVTRTIPTGSYLMLDDGSSELQTLKVTYDLGVGGWYSIAEGTLTSSFSRKSLITYRVYVVTTSGIFITERSVPVAGYSYYNYYRLSGIWEKIEKGVPVLTLAGRFDTKSAIDLVFGWIVISEKAIISKSDTEIKVDMNKAAISYYSDGDYTITVGNSGSSSTIVGHHEYLSTPVPVPSSTP